MRLITTMLVSALLLGSMVGIVQSAPISTEASDNATVQPTGPRGIPAGKDFFNMQGSGGGGFSSYGVADFDFGALGTTVLTVNSASLCLTQDPAFFSADGDLAFSFDKSATLADIQPGITSPLAYDGADPGTDTDEADGDLDLEAAGTGTFIIGATGDLDVYPLTLNATSKTLLVDALNNQKTIRVVIGTGEPGVAATYSGFSNADRDGPVLKLDVTFDDGTPTETTTWGRMKALYK